MRLRTFTAGTMTEAMAQVREKLGPEAIIVSTEEDADGGMRVIAAIDPAEPPIEATGDPDVIDALAAHGLAPPLIEKILCSALPFDSTDPLLALSGTLASLFTFAAIEEPQPRPLLFVGPPGAGKTMSIAKLATRAVLGGMPVRLVTADTVRAGGIEQLEAFAKALKLPLHRAASAQRLAPIAASARPEELMLID